MNLIYVGHVRRFTTTLRSRAAGLIYAHYRDYLPTNLIRNNSASMHYQIAHAAPIIMK